MGIGRHQNGKKKGGTKNKKMAKARDKNLKNLTKT